MTLLHSGIVSERAQTHGFVPSAHNAELAQRSYNLNRFPVDTLKIDRSFVISMNRMETEDQLDQLRILKCQYAQGYFFSKPLEVLEADLFVLNGAQINDGNVPDLATADFAMWVFPQRMNRVSYSD